MPLILPNFKGRRCIEASFCGQVAPKEAAQIPAQQELPKMLVALYEQSGTEVYFGLLRPFPGEKMHVHFTLATAERFGDEPPTVNSDVETVLATVQPFFGQKIDVYVKGLFRASRSELPPFIRSAFTATVADDVQVRMTAATLAVRGAPVHSISWELKARAPAEIRLEARTQMALDGPFFDKGLDILESGFRAFIVKEPCDV